VQAAVTAIRLAAKLTLLPGSDIFAHPCLDLLNRSAICKHAKKNAEALYLIQLRFATVFV
jgi:hypothetical protein